MSRTMENSLKQAKNCEICSELRPLSSHLFELAEFCKYLGNSVKYDNGEVIRDVHSVIIGCTVPLYHLGLASTYFIRNKQPRFPL